MKMDRFGWSATAGILFFFLGAFVASFLSAVSFWVRLPFLFALLCSAYTVAFLPKSQGDSAADFLLIRLVPLVVMLACLVRL